MNCVFSTVHDRWLLIRQNSFSSPIDNSLVKIRAAGKLFEPKVRRSDYRLGRTDRLAKSNLINSSKFNCSPNLSKTENGAKQPESILMDNQRLHFCKPNRRAQFEVDYKLQSSQYDQDVLNFNTNVERAEVTRNAVEDNADKIVNSFHPFSTEMNPLRKSKSAPSPFKRYNRGAENILLSMPIFVL